MTTPSGGAPKIGLGLNLPRPAPRPAPAVAAPAAPAVSPPAVPQAAPVAATLDPAAALAAVVAGIPAPAVSAALSITDLQMDDFFQPDDFVAGTSASMKIRNPNGVTVAVLHFDGADFAITSPAGSGITYDVTKGIATTTDIAVSQRLQDGDVIIIKIPNQTEQLRWIWKTPAIQPAAATPSPPVPAPAPPAASAPVATVSPPAVAPSGPLTADEVHDRLTPVGAVDSTAVLSPSDICFRVETLRTIGKGVEAAMVANGYQGSIEGLSGVGHTRKGAGNIVNRTGIGYAVVRAENSRVAPTEVCIAAEGTNEQASGLVIAEILAQLTHVDPEIARETSIAHVVSLVEQGIKAAHDSIRALAPDADGKSQGTTVQVSIKNEETVVNLWIGDTVGFAVHAATGWSGRYNPAHSLNPMSFTPPDMLQADGSPIDGNIADEGTWLKAAGADAKPILLGREDTYTPAHNTFVNGPKVELEQGGWYGMGSSRLLGKGLGLGNVRDAILGAKADEIYYAPHRIMENWVRAVDSGKSLQIRGSQMSSRQAHAALAPRKMTDGSIAFWLSRVPLPRQRDAERKAASAILRRLRTAKPTGFTVTDKQLQDANLYRLLGAAELAKHGRYKNPNIIRHVLGISATTP